MRAIGLARSSSGSRGDAPRRSIRMRFAAKSVCPSRRIGARRLDRGLSLAAQSRSLTPNRRPSPVPVANPLEGRARPIWMARTVRSGKQRILAMTCGVSLGVSVAFAPSSCSSRGYGSPCPAQEEWRTPPIGRNHSVAQAHRLSISVGPIQGLLCKTCGVRSVLSALKNEEWECASGGEERDACQRSP